jgi:hypothetical protein
MTDLCRVRFTTSSGDECCFEGIFLATQAIASVYQIVGGFQSSQMIVPPNSDKPDSEPYLIFWRRFDGMASGTDLDAIGDEQIWARVFPGITHLVQFLKTCAADSATQELDQVDYDQLLQEVQTAISGGS